MGMEPTNAEIQLQQCGSTTVAPRGGQQQFISPMLCRVQSPKKDYRYRPSILRTHCSKISQMESFAASKTKTKNPRIHRIKPKLNIHTHPQFLSFTSFCVLSLALDSSRSGLLGGLRHWRGAKGRMQTWPRDAQKIDAEGVEFVFFNIHDFFGYMWIHWCSSKKIMSVDIEVING